MAFNCNLSICSAAWSPQPAIMIENLSAGTRMKKSFIGLLGVCLRAAYFSRKKATVHLVFHNFFSSLILVSLDLLLRFNCESITSERVRSIICRRVRHEHEPRSNQIDCCVGSLCLQMSGRRFTCAADSKHVSLSYFKITRIVFNNGYFFPSPLLSTILRSSDWEIAGFTRNWFVSGLASVAYREIVPSAPRMGISQTNLHENRDENFDDSLVSHGSNSPRLAWGVRIERNREPSTDFHTAATDSSGD